ncbi:hypothetical protein CHARACLAT_008075 [Characodon lateralis]|uniref:Uncharacterized protein n=1 Tax=Characodon lateralis TaxID=208331 RepID=A0ABU7F148_9TELE|nr:hypothetical protein [Characodon lateralis]
MNLLLRNSPPLLTTIDLGAVSQLSLALHHSSSSKLTTSHMSLCMWVKTIKRTMTTTTWLDQATFTTQTRAFWTCEF